MKRTLPILVLFLLHFSNVHSQELNSFDIQDNPGNLKSYVYSPEGLNDSLNYPLVVILHGCTQNAKQMHEQTGWKELADSNQFHLVYPEQRKLNNPNSCFCWYQDSDIERGKGEVASIYEMIQKISDSLNVDSTRIFVYGLSAGAAMSLAVMACYPEKINAGAVLAGGPYKSVSNPLKAISQMKNPDKLTEEERGKKVMDQNPVYKGKYPRLILLHGEKDKVVSFDNSLEIMKQWKDVAKIDSDSLSLIDDYDGKPGFWRLAPVNRDGSTPIVLYALQKLGHSLAVDPGTGKRQGGKTGMFSKDMDVFSTWYIARDFGLIRNE